jgi:hypothetical protein
VQSGVRRIRLRHIVVSGQANRLTSSYFSSLASALSASPATLLISFSKEFNLAWFSAAAHRSSFTGFDFAEFSGFVVSDLRLLKVGSSHN